MISTKNNVTLYNFCNRLPTILTEIFHISKYIRFDHILIIVYIKDYIIADYKYEI